MNFKLLTSLFLGLYASVLWAADPARVIFVAGDARVAGRAVRVGDAVQEGQLLTTAQDGYLYIQTIDHGFFILRPSSTGQIVSYQIDTVNPANTRIKIELKAGVARHISGDAVKDARQNFRFNTPIAAIGVRGTDFTVYASPETTSVSVLSGGVVVSPLTSTCAAAGFGPCEGAVSKELFASSASQVLQVKRDQVPVLLQGSDQAPDAVAPPRPDEPATSAKTSATKAPAGNPVVATALNNLDPLKSNLINQVSNQAVTSQPDLSGQLIWGRWQKLLDQTIEVDVAGLQASHQLIATNSHYALMRDKNASWQMPLQSTLDFSLKLSQAVIYSESTRQTSEAQLENGHLQLNFANASFFTKFDLVSLNERFALQSTGDISKDGKLYGGYQFLRPNNMDVRGALAGDNSAAAYLFQARLDSQRLASGATLWGK